MRRALTLLALLTGLTGILLPLSPARGPACPTLASIEAWEEAWAGLDGGRFAGDGVESVADPRDRNRTYFVFGDSAVRGSGGDPLFLHNTMVRLDRGCLERIGGDAEIIPNPADGSHYYWGGPMVVDGGNLNVFARRVRSTSDRPQGFEVLGIDLAVLRLPAGGDPVFAGFRPTPSSGRPGVEGALTWGSGAVGYGPHVYVYGVRRSGVRRTMYLARVPSGLLGRPRAWRFWNGSGYGRSEEAAVPVAAPNVDEAFSVHVVAGTWTIVSKDGTFGDTVQMLTGSQPHGPFHPSPLFDAPWNETTSTYLAMYHGHISFLNRAHPVSVSRSPRRGSLPLLFEHPELYRPLWRPAPGAGEGVWLYPATGPMG